MKRSKLTTPEPPNPSGLCQCGCGGKTELARMTSNKFGWLQGHPLRYIHGHQSRIQNGKADFSKPRFTLEDGPLETKCHIWNHGTSNGYPKENGLYVHHASTGPIPEGFERHHKCLNRLCVNPDHIEVMPKSLHSFHRYI